MRKYRKLLYFLSLCIISIVLCSYGEKPPIMIWKTSSGKEYAIFKIGEWYSSEYPKMFTVRFKSENYQDSTICFEEFHDIYIYVAQNYDLEGFTHVGLEAVDKSEAIFGCGGVMGRRDNKTIEEINKLKSKIIKKSS